MSKTSRVTVKVPPERTIYDPPTGEVPPFRIPGDTSVSGCPLNRIPDPSSETGTPASPGYDHTHALRKTKVKRQE